MGDVVAGGRLGHSNHEMTEFSVLCKGREMDKNLYPGFLEGALWSIQDTDLESPLGSSPLKQRGPRRLVILLKRNLEGTRAAWRYVPKDELVEKKTCLAEQEAFPGTQQIKRRCITFGKRAGSSGRVEGCY